MPNDVSGVYPVYENQFQVNTAASGATAAFSDIADMESFSVSIDNNVEEWTPFTTEGWTRRLMTGKSITITVQGKRNVGDTGNDYIAGLYMKNGREAEADFKWTFPDGSSLTFTGAVVNITNIGAGDSMATFSGHGHSVENTGDTDLLILAAIVKD